MKNKKSVSLFSALMILFFHLWVNVTKGAGFEQFIRQTAYIGVDIFFFLSAYSLAGREPGKYWKFVLSRFKAVYLKYVVFAFIAMMISSWSAVRFFKVISGAELFIKGGGSFLWFLPAILIIYVLFPLYSFLDKKNRIVTLIISCLLWIAGTFLVSYFTSYKEIFIFTNRLPIFLLGFYFSKLNIMEKLQSKKWMKLLLGFVLTFAGYFLLYKFGYQGKLQKPVVDAFYLVAIVAAIGIVLLVSFIPEVAPIKIIGAATLEMYAVQMVFGYKFASFVLKHARNAFVINVVVFLFVILVSVIIHYAWVYAEKGIRAGFCKLCRKA